ncbi:MAG TPA: sulfite exporter TauE/SafE family protein, partial [Candidatus Eisenbacteria bacterium]|nr:sulfite exporter TauE/SafE family protein [Candidatus Eisenbacteria bacterium]
MQRHVTPVLLGIVSGLLGGLMGVGGGIVLVPLLVHLLRMGQHEAQGTSLAFVIATALVAVIPYYGNERLDLVLAAALTLGAVPGVMVGSRVAARISARTLRIAFGAFLLLVAVRILVAPPLESGGPAAWPLGWNVLTGFGVGVLAGLLGVGGGTILVPLLVLGQGVDQHTAQGISLLMIVPVGIVGVWSYAREGRLPSDRLPALLVGGAAGGLLGALLAHRTAA